LITIYPDAETQVVWENFKIIAKRDGFASASELLRKVMGDYVKAHIGSNEQFLLTKWNDDPGLKAFPTLGENPVRYLSNSQVPELQELQAQIRLWDKAVSQKLASLQPKEETPPQAKKDYTRCPSCNLPILGVYKLSDHYYSHPECHPKEAAP
jgi:hypothetical protein